MQNNLKPWLTILCTVVFLSLWSQENPVRTWTGLGAGMKLSKNWDIQAQTQWRTEAGDIDAYLVELTTGRKWGKGFKTSTGLRRTWRHDDQGGLQGYQKIERWFLQNTYKHETGPLDWRHRVLYQHDRVINREKPAEQHLRWLTEATYRIKNWEADPSLGFEWFHHVDHPQRSGGAGWRIILGSEIKSGKNKTWKFDYLFDQNLIQGIPDSHSHILKLTLDLDL